MNDDAAKCPKRSSMNFITLFYTVTLLNVTKYDFFWANRELERTKEYALEVGFLYDVAKKDLEEEEAENERLTSELRDLETALSTSTEIEV